MRLFSGLIVVFVIAAPALAQEPEPAVTLEEAVERALRASPAIIQAEGATLTAGSGERSAWGSFLPTFSLTSGASLSSTERFNPQTNTPVTGSQDSYSAGLSGSIDLFTGGRRLAELRRARAETDAAEASLLADRYTVTLSAKRAFFDVLRGDELTRVARLRLERAENGLEAAERRLRVGSATLSDILRSKLELNQARQGLLEATTQRRTAAFTLGRVVGAEGPVAARLASPLQVRPVEVPAAELVADLQAHSPAVRAAQAASAAADAGRSSARTQYFPSLRLSGGTDWFNQDAALDNGRTSWSLRLGLSYPIFNGFQREAAVDRASVEANVARVRLEDARRAARVDAERLLAALKLAEERLALAEEAATVAQEDLRVQEERYRLGASTILDRISSQISLVEAEQGLVAARYDYHLARAELEALAGREL